MTNGHNGRIFVVEDDADIANMLKIYFDNQGYEVEVASKGKDALPAIRKNIPSLIVLDINLPDMTGFDIAAELRDNIRTSHVPIIFLTQKDERADRMVGLESGAVDYITKPFDIEELKLRIQNTIAQQDTSRKIDSISNLPTGSVVEEHLRGLMRDDEASWSYVDMKIKRFEAFSEVYGWSSGDEVIRALAQTLQDVVDAHGGDDDFIGHPGRDHFVVITESTDVQPLVDALTTRFDEDIQQHYSFIDRERGYMLDGDEQVDLMTLRVGVVSTETHEFSDLREVIERAADERRGKQRNSDEADDDILSAW